MLTIWKYELRPDGATVGIPRGFKILAVQSQRDAPCIWALVDPEAPEDIRTFRVYGTGHSLPAELATWKHIGTFQLSGGALVFHAFMAPAEEELR